MTPVKLVSPFYDDMDTSDSSENASEFEADQNIANGINDDYINELEERQKYVQEFINKSFQHFKQGLDFEYIHDQDMNYYKETYRYNDINDDRPMLGPSEDNSQEAVSNDDPDYDPEYDEEVNRLLDEVQEEILHENSNPATEDNSVTKNGCDDSKNEQYEDFYDEFPDDCQHVGPVPQWYQVMVEKKIKEAKRRLGDLSNMVCYGCAAAAAHIKRIEQDHSTIFCKMDYPRHPPLDKPWTNFWKFNCMIKCKEIEKPNHAHTADCESVLLVHATTGVSTETPNISPNEYPKFVMDAVELFQDFAIETTKNVPYLDASQATDTVYERPVWTEMKLRSNYKNELMIVVRGKGVTSLISKLKRYFESGPGRTSNVISVYCINQKRSQKKGVFHPTYVHGIFKLRDKVGPISINYEPKTSMAFNSVEAIQLGRVIQDYAGLTKETYLMDIGCNFGVLSLMMSHKCSSVIALNTAHFVTSEISQAEELKRFNTIHNVSFMPCDPKEILTKCSTIIKRHVTVAVLNLSSPYGKSIHVMQALRDLPTIWRVIVYGPFTKEFHRNISLLTCKDDTMGDKYLPMQGCILDKSPSVDNAFDVVILFERKSLIAPQVELMAPGPTLNLKHDCEEYDYGSLDVNDDKPVIKLEKGFGKPDFRSKKFSGGKPFRIYRGPLNKFGKFDSPMLPMEKEQKPEMPKDKPKERSPSPHANERKFDCSVLRQKPQENSTSPPAPERKFDCSVLRQKPQNGSPSPPTSERSFDCSMLRKKPPAVPTPAYKGKDRSVYPSIRKELQVKELKRRFDSPYLPLPKGEVPPTTPSPPAFDSSVLRREKQFDALMPKSQQKLSRDTQPPLPSSFVSVKKEFHISCPTPPRERYPSPPPPPPPTEHRILDSSQIKKEKDVDYPSVTGVKAEPVDSYDDKEEGELSSPEDDTNTRIANGSKALDPSYFVGFSDVKVPPVTVKSEPASYIKNEPEDMLISPILEDIENMVTPVHNPRALSGSPYPSRLPASTSIITAEGFNFAVQANESFMGMILEQKAPPNAAFKIKLENDPNDSDDEIKIIGAKQASVRPNKQQKDAELRIRVKSLDEIIKEKSESETNDDLRNLIEKRKTIQRKLDRNKEIRCYKVLHGRSPTPDLPRKYKRDSSPSPPPPFRKYKRELSPSPSPPFRKYNRSPSPRRYVRSPSPRRRGRSPSPLPKRYLRSPSPRRYVRSPSPYRSRSPSSRRYRRSPTPTKTWIKRDKSPSVRRSRRSPSPIKRTYKRSPPSPIRFKREPRSPIRFKKEPLSPVSSRWGTDRNRRSPTSASPHKPHNKWEIRRKSKSPIKSRHESRKKRSRSKSPAEAKRKRISLSPISLSPSPTRKRDVSAERKKKKKKAKSNSKSQSKSPTRAAKKKSKISKDDSTWDIPVLSTLPSSQDDKSQSKDTDKSVPVEQTEPAKQERSSRSRSRTPIPGVEDIQAELTVE